MHSCGVGNTVNQRVKKKKEFLAFSLVSRLVVFGNLLFSCQDCFFFQTLMEGNRCPKQREPDSINHLNVCFNVLFFYNPGCLCVRQTLRLKCDSGRVENLDAANIPHTSAETETFCSSFFFFLVAKTVRTFSPSRG